MSTNMVSLELNQDMVKPILEKQIQAAILANIGDPEKLIEVIVSRALKEKVDHNGRISEYRSDNRFDFLELLAKDAIREAAKEGLKVWLKENAQLVKAKVIEEMYKPERMDSIVRAFAEAAERSFSSSWNFSCNIKFEAEK